MGMQTGHKALHQIICDHLCQGTTYTGIDGQDNLASLQMQQDKKYSTDKLNKNVFFFHMFC